MEYDALRVNPIMRSFPRTIRFEGTQQSLWEQGPIVKIELGLPDHQDEFPYPISTFAKIDTGAAICAIDSSLASRLQLPIIGSGRAGTIDGLMKDVLHFSVQMRFPDVDLSFAPRRVLSADLSQLKLYHEAEMLIGRDVLAFGVFRYDGKLGNFSLSFLESPMELYCPNNLIGRKSETA